MITTLLPHILGGSSMSYSVTIGQSGGDYGWSSLGGNSYGSIDPPVLDVNDILVNQFTCEGGTSDFTLRLDTWFYVLPRASYRGVMVTSPGDSTTKVFRTEDADEFTSYIGTARWRWGNGSSPLWDNSELGQVATVRLLL